MIGHRYFFMGGLFRSVGHHLFTFREFSQAFGPLSFVIGQFSQRIEHPFGFRGFRASGFRASFRAMPAFVPGKVFYT
jgi:hypothetical protein